MKINHLHIIKPGITLFGEEWCSGLFLTGSALCAMLNHTNYFTGCISALHKHRA